MFPAARSSTKGLAGLSSATAQLEGILLLNKPGVSSKHIDPGALTSQVFAIAAQCGTPAQLEAENQTHSSDVSQRIAEFQRLVQQCLDRITEIKQYNASKITDIRSTMLTLIKADDGAALEQTFKDYQGGADSLEYLAYGLRVAAAEGKLKCLAYLIKSRCANILQAGKDSGKVAIHRAVENGHVAAFTALLRATDNQDYYAPCRQLQCKLPNGQDTVDLIAASLMRDKFIEAAKAVLEDPSMSDHKMGDFSKLLQRLTVLQGQKLKTKLAF